MKGYSFNLVKFLDYINLIKLVEIPAGMFQMGSAGGVGYPISETPLHTVQFSKPFWMGKYPVTQSQWRIVAGLPSINRDLAEKLDHTIYNDNLPVVNVDWYDTEEFCARLSKATGCTYRLPSEAEWEYACRAGTTSQFYFGDCLSPDLANYYSSQDKRIGVTKVDTFPANAWGVHDMHGNVREWCYDHWHYSYSNAPDDGSPWIDSDSSLDEDDKWRVMRGGTWESQQYNCRSASRNFDTPGFKSYCLGFRVVRIDP